MHRHFEHSLEELKETLVVMGSLVDRQIDSAAHALFSGDTRVAQEVIGRDGTVDDFDTRVDALCQSILALNQPVAGDLRLLMAALRINTQLERIGDIAVNIAERVEPLAGSTALIRTTRLAEMLQIARIMVTDSLSAFLNGDPALARRVMETDFVVDDLDRHIFRHLVHAMEVTPSLIPVGAHMLMLSRHIERLADHATNIAEDVIFLVDARSVRHAQLDDRDR
jgi:phosphate transport system protein